MQVSGKSAFLILLVAAGTGLFFALASSPGLPSPKQVGADVDRAGARQIVVVNIEPARPE